MTGNSEKTLQLLVAGLAHELRNPLNTLSVLTYAMTEQAESNGLRVADLEVVRLGDDAAELRPVVLQREDQVLKIHGGQL